MGSFAKRRKNAGRKAAPASQSLLKRALLEIERAVRAQY
jgi:hypothetical protein